MRSGAISPTTLLVIAVLAGISCSDAKASDCTELTPPASLRGADRSLSSDDLLRLRDIGPNAEMAWQDGAVTLSADGRQAAFQLRQADPTNNRYCIGMVVLDLGTGAFMFVDRDGEPLKMAIDLRGSSAIPTGIFRAVTPRWAADNKWIAFLKRDGGHTQVWKAQADGSGSMALTAEETDVEDFRFASDGDSLIIATRPGLDEGRAAIDREGLSGWRYDDRYVPALSNKPFVPAPVERHFLVVDPATGSRRIAGQDEVRMFSGGQSNPAMLDVGSPGHARTARIATLPSSPLKPVGQLVADDIRGTEAACTSETCKGYLQVIGWSSDHRTVRYLRREGWAKASTAIYEWTPGRHRPRRILETTDLLGDCQNSTNKIVCVREGASTPRRIVVIDPASGASSTIFDPNPEFARLKLGRVERLNWKNAFGLEGYGDLVFPVGYEPGTKYPLVIVQYETRGFLRGGTGDEFPIQVFANQGFAVLSVSRPPDIGVIRGAETVVDVERRNLEGFADRRSVLDSLRVGLQRAISAGIVDEARIGLTGFSDGASTAQFALLHGPKFAAVSLGSCCWDESLPIRVGPRAMRIFRSQGYPGLTDEADTFWSEISLVRNAHSISTPILMQISDSEYLSALTTYTALAESKTSVELYVFPGEYHVTNQPSHRRAIYERNLQWFEHWLRPAEGSRP